MCDLTFVLLFVIEPFSAVLLQQCALGFNFLKVTNTDVIRLECILKDII